MNLNLTGKTALVSGSSQGIGRAAAIELAELGANVILLARNKQSLEEVKSALDTTKGQKHDLLVADFSKPEEVKHAIESYIKNAEGPVHILVNNTGGPPPGPVNAAGEQEFLAAFNQHLICNHILMQAVLPGMKHASYGRIINVISTSVKAPLPNLGVSNTIRAAVANWSKTLATEVAQYGVTVNNVLPGATFTGRLQSIITNKAEKTGNSQDVVEDHMLSEIPAKRFAKPEEVANAIAFLASPAAAYINGINLPVDGGRTVCL